MEFSIFDEFHIPEDTSTLKFCIPKDKSKMLFVLLMISTIFIISVLQMSGGKSSNRTYMIFLSTNHQCKRFYYLNSNIN